MCPGFFTGICIFSTFFYRIGPSDPNTGRIEPISYTMIVSGLLNPFLAILDFFILYHALVTLCKLENLGNLTFLAIFVSKMVEIAHFGGHFFGQKIALNRAISVGISIFWLFW